MRSKVGKGVSDESSSTLNHTELAVAEDGRMGFNALGSSPSPPAEGGEGWRGEGHLACS